MDVGPPSSPPAPKVPKRAGSSPHTQRPRCHAESEPGESTGPPRTPKSISLAAALGGVHGGDFRYISHLTRSRTRETGQPGSRIDPGGGLFEVWGDILRGGSLPAVSSPYMVTHYSGSLYQRARPHTNSLYAPPDFTQAVRHQQSKHPASKQAPKITVSRGHSLSRGLPLTQSSSESTASTSSSSDSLSLPSRRAAASARGDADEPPTVGIVGVEAGAG